MNILSDLSLAPYNSFGIDTTARHFVRIEQPSDAENLIDSNLFDPQSCFILGGGSNILLTRPVAGMVLLNEIKGKKIVAENNEQVVLEVGAGENWHELVLYCLKNDWGGIENLSLIPGKVGAAPIQNIGAYGVELKEVFVSLRALNIWTGNWETFDKAACQFGYRDSYFKRAGKGKYLITSIRLKLNKAPHALNLSYGAIQSELNQLGKSQYTISDISEVVCKIRRSKLPDPKQIGNAGSFFKNPVISAGDFQSLHKKFPNIPHYPQADGQVKVPAGWLIEQAGWKGKRIEQYGVHHQQALVLVNYGGASGQHLYDLSESILQDIQDKFSIQLEREVNIW